MPRIPTLRDSHGVSHYIVEQGVSVHHSDCGRAFSGASPKKRPIDRITRKCSDCRFPPEDADRWHPLVNLEDDL